MDLKDYRVQLPSTIQQQQRFALTLPFAWLETKYVFDQKNCSMATNVYLFLPFGNPLVTGDKEGRNNRRKTLSRNPIYYL